MSNDDFNILFMKIFDKHAPLKKKYVRANEGPFMTKELKKEIMKRTKLLNIYRRDKSFRSRQAYRRQRNICTRLCKRNKRDYYSNLHPSCVTSNKKFWKSVKPLFSEKSLTKDNITLIEKGSITDGSKEVADTFSDFFINAVRNFCIERERNFCNYDNLDTIADPISKAINRFEFHPSILKIQETIKIKDLFVFTHITPRDVVNEILHLNVSTACPKDCIPSHVMKDNIDIFSLKLSNDFNHSIEEGYFPSNLKYADGTPIHKKGDRPDKSTYSPVSILPAMSKIMELLILQQLHILSKYQCGFRKHFSSQQCLILMLEKWKQTLDSKGVSGALLTDLSKAFDCLVIKAKLNAYGFGYKALKVIRSYLVN